MGSLSNLYATLTPTPFVVPISNGSGLLDDWVTPALTNPMTTDQDLIVGGFGGDPTRLAVGPIGYVLTVGSAGVIDWEPSSGGFLNPMTTSQDLIVGGVAGAPGRLGVGSVGKVLTVGSGGIIDWETPAASGGTVTTLSVVSANGFAGSVANPTTTPAITLTTTITGVIKGNGTALSAASAGTDYVAPGAITTSGLTMATAKMLGRATASTGAIEEIATTGTGSAVLATAPTFPSTFTLGAASGTTGAINFKGTTSGTVTLSVADAAGTNTFKLPATAGSNTNVLATDGSGNLFWQAAGSGGGTVNSGTATQFAYYPATAAAVSSTGTLTVSSLGRLTLTPTAVTTGSTNPITITMPGDTGLATTVESIGINVVGGTRQWVDGTIALQREYVFGGPTWNRQTSIVTITTGTTMQIGAPVAGGGVTITNPFALILGGALGIGGSPPFATLSQTSGAITLASGGSNQNLNITPSGTGLVTCNGDVLNTDNVSFRTWQGQAALVGRGIFTQRAATTSGLYCLAVGSVDTQIEGSVVSGSYGSLTATASGRGLGVNLRTYGGTTWTVAAGMSFLTTQTQSESARGSQILFKTTTNSTTTLNTVLTLDQDQNATFSLGVKTGAPAGGTAAFWKHGVLVTAAVTPDITRYIQLDVGGTLYKLIVST